MTTWLIVGILFCLVIIPSTILVICIFAANNIPEEQHYD
jgi:hypothetical protein